MGQPLAAYYTMDVNEQWRDSAALVLGTPGCASGAIHVYGDASNYRFFTQSIRPNLQLIEIPWEQQRTSAVSPPPPARSYFGSSV